MRRLTAWWDTDQFDAVSSFLCQRGLLPAARRLMAVVNVSAAAVPLSELINERHPTAWAVTAGVVTAGFTLGTAVSWLTRWPTRRQSTVTVLLGVFCILGWSVAQPSAVVAVLACAAAPVTGAYIGFFHGPRLLVVNTVMAVGVTAAALTRLAATTATATVTAAFWLIVFLNVSLPVGIHAMSRAMCGYARSSEEDPLTGLLNRRGFLDALDRRLAQPTPTHTYLAVVMIDLDDFKRINDTHGHAVGDQALQTVAALLRGCLPPHAVVSRAGGEEFLIAFTTEGPDALASLTPGVCTAIAKLSHQMTASIGTALTEIHRLRGSEHLHHLIATADTAMYTAKHRGGNQVHHA